MRRFDRFLKRLTRKNDHHFFSEPLNFPTRLRLIARISLRFLWVYCIFLIIALTMTLGSGMDIYHRTEMPQFCATCHEMGNNFGSWEVSMHKSIKCVDCHTRPGLSGWMAAKLSGTRQLLTHLTAETIDDIDVNDHQRQLVSENCKRCHAGAARLSEVDGRIISHERHLEIGIDCVECHSQNFAHPEFDPGQKDWKPPLVDEMDCIRCHDGKNTFGKATAFAAASETNCVRCHPDSLAGNSHGGEEMECNYCHESDSEVHFSVTRESVGEICSNCHDDLGDDHESQHLPFADGLCSDCHSVMSPAHLYLDGAEPSTAACLSCHEEIEVLFASPEGSALSRFSNQDLDLHRTHQKELGDLPAWCLKCHDSHGSESAVAMIRLRSLESRKLQGDFEPSDSGGTCTTECHEDLQSEYTRSPEGQR